MHVLGHPERAAAKEAPRLEQCAPRRFSVYAARTVGVNPHEADCCGANVRGLTGWQADSKPDPDHPTPHCQTDLDSPVTPLLSSLVSLLCSPSSLSVSQALRPLRSSVILAVNSPDRFLRKYSQGRYWSPGEVEIWISFGIRCVSFCFWTVELILLIGRVSVWLEI